MIQTERALPTRQGAFCICAQQLDFRLGRPSLRPTTPERGRDWGQNPQRRRSNRPGNSQAKGPREEILWKAGFCTAAPTEGITPPEPGDRKAKSLRSETEGRGLPSGVPGNPCSGATELTENTLRTPLYDAHVALKARMVPFAGYEMPVQYPDRNPDRTQLDPRTRWPVRRLAHGPVSDCGGEF